MVKKLFKHEFLFYARVMAIVYAILLTIATATRIVFLFDPESSTYLQIVYVFTNLIYFVSVAAAMGFAFVMAIVRFYKNMFTCEGYLTFTLPVSAGEHIMVKVITAVSVNFVTWLVVILSGCIVASGEAFADMVYQLGLGMELLYEQAGLNIVFFLIEFFVLLVLASFTSIMLYYTFISIGQLSKKNRILAAVGAYFVYYIITQVIGSIVSIFITIFASTGALDEVSYWISLYPFEAMHIFMCGSILFSTLFGILEFVIIRWIITKKLNLE